MSESWNYLQHGAAQGPVNVEALRSLLASGQLGPEDLVWRPGLPEWTRAGQFPELLAAPAPLPPPPVLTPEPVPAPLPAAPVLQISPEPVLPAPSDGPEDLASALAALRSTKPWVRFLGVLGILGIVFLVLVALIFLAVTSVLSSALPGMPPAMRFLLPVAYLLIAVLQLPPVIFLNRYASRIGTLVRTRSTADLAEALHAQKSFWRYVGIATLVVLCLEALSLVLVVAGAALAAGHRF